MTKQEAEAWLAEIELANARQLNRILDQLTVLATGPDCWTTKKRNHLPSLLLDFAKAFANVGANWMRSGYHLHSKNKVRKLRNRLEARMRVA